MAPTLLGWYPTCSATSTSFALEVSEGAWKESKPPTSNQLHQQKNAEGWNGEIVWKKNECQF